MRTGRARGERQIDGAMMGEDKRPRRVKVQTRLDEFDRQIVLRTATPEGVKMLERRRHAATTFVDPKPPKIIPTDRWTPPLVAGRLRRMARLFTRFPMTADIRPPGIRSHMPEPLLDRNRDYAPDPTPPRVPLKQTEIDLAVTTFKVVLRFVAGDDRAHAILRGILWSIALGRSFGDCSEDLISRGYRVGTSEDNLRLIWAEKLGPAVSELFNSIPVPITRADLAEVRIGSFHRIRV